MKFYFDESGDFRLDSDCGQRVGIVAGITIPETAETEIFAKFDDFVRTLPRSAFKCEEPKGNLLGTKERRQFAQMIADDRKIVVTPAMLDIGSIIRSQKQVRQSLVKRIEKLAEQCIYETMREETLQLAKRFNNLSDSQSLRLGTVAYCIKRAFEQTIMLLSGKQYYECWDQMRFEIDPVQVRKESREELVFKWTMLGWLQGWSLKNPTVIITEIHTKDHPLLKKYSTADHKFDLTKIYRDNLHYPRSSESKGLQIADMAASILHHAVCGIATFDNLTDYGLLLTNNLWPSNAAHGLFCLTCPSDVDYKIYEGLTEAVAKAKGGVEWRGIVRRRLGI